MPKTVEDILREDGLSLKILERLSYHSALGINLKKNLHYFNKELLLDELRKIAKWYDSHEELRNVAVDYRIKSIQSAFLKYQRYYPDHQAAKVFNDMLGFRTLCDNYEEMKMILRRN